MKLSKARRDQYRKLAKQEGYRSRAAFKLLQLNRSYKIIKRSDRVVEFGCAPGGWLQVAKQLVGPTGFVLGLDLREISPLEGTHFIKCSIDDPSLLEILAHAIGQYNKADVMLSDLSPNVSGIWEIDQERQISLTMKAVHLTTKILRKEGNAVFKIFQGSSLKHLLSDLKDNFRSVKLSKPPASRQESSELYVICLGFKK